MRAPTPGGRLLNLFIFKFMRLCFLALLSVLSLQTWSQHRVDGRLIQSQTQEGVEDAYIALLAGDSLLATTLSDNRGYFQLFVPKKTGLVLVISHVAYESQQLALHPDSLTNLSILLQPIVKVTDEAVVRATRMGKELPGSYSQISKKDIERSNLGQDLPFLLNQIPGTVVNSDAGAGIGYTGIRIRGIDPTRINVTINGIPVNDAESQGMWWVNMPDFASSVQNIQVQRGVGTSTNGAAAFGASINLQTNAVRKDPFAEVSYGVGFLKNDWSYKQGNSPLAFKNGWNLNTQKRNIVFGTGLLENNWSFEGRISQIKSDGFIDRSSSDLQSYYLSGAHYGKKSVFKVNVFGGKEITYQAWNGIPDAKVKGDAAGLEKYYAFYLDDSTRLANSGNRTYNAYTYDNEVDHYQQQHVHVHYSYQFNPRLLGNISLHTTLGKGYYEQFRSGEDLADYNLPPVFAGGDTIESTDLIRRRWLDNTFSGFVYSLNYATKKLNLIFGGGYNLYSGKHFGEIIWAQFASTGSIRHRYYDNDARKSDMNVYGKATYSLSTRLSVFADLQYRFISYRFLGYDAGGNNVTQSVQYPFFNPKAGMSYSLNANSQLYLTYSRANREPVREDFINSTPKTRPRHEILNNVELGWNLQNQNHRFQVVAYSMMYKDQLTLTGKINDVGGYTRVNVDQSYRAGLEFDYTINLRSWLQWNATLALSQNKVMEFAEYVDAYDVDWNYLGQQSINHKNVDLAYSPKVVASSMFRFILTKELSVDWMSKYVGKQYLDNTQNKERSLDAFWVNDLRLNLATKKLKLMQELRFSLLAANILNAEYEPNGYSFGFIYDGQRSDFNYLFPQAGTNFLGQLTFSF